MELEVYNISGKLTDKRVKLSDMIFSIEPNDHAIYLDVKQHLANRRQGTHKAKERGELSGSTKKLHKQKGTGGSRKGSIKNPLYRGGPRVFGPRPRDYSFKLNKKLKNLARCSALSYKIKEGSLTVLEDFNFELPKTKNYINILNIFSITGIKSLFVLGENSKNVLLSSRNIPNTKVIQVSDLNTYNILKYKKIFFTESVIPEIENILID